MSLYITATIEDLTDICKRCNQNCFSRSALATIIEWHDDEGKTREWDCTEIRGEWSEYDDAGKMWADFYMLDQFLPEIYEPDQLEDLIAAIESKFGSVWRLDNGNWLIQEA